MNGAIVSYVGALLVFSWGVAHLFATTSVVRGFGEISPDNKRIITMEWIIEGIVLIFIGVLVGLVTYLDRSNSVARAVYWMSFGVLNILSVVSLFTGARNSFMAFRLCPYIFTGTSIMILIGSYVG